MPEVINQIFMVLVLILCFDGSFAIKCIFINNQQFLVGATLIDLNLDELYYYSFIVSMNRCHGRCTTVEELVRRICFHNKMRDMNLKVFNMINKINESKTLAKHISCECRYEFNGRKYNSRQNWNNDKCQYECKKPIKHGNRIMLGILVDMLVSVIRILTLVNTWKTMNA